ncbi:MAG: terpene cyclase/mutase family protein [Planctomycetia bacterium]|nr:terpene cyclase/mutase family protein [Planctomycetia bacterium]
MADPRAANEGPGVATHQAAPPPSATAANGSVATAAPEPAKGAARSPSASAQTATAASAKAPSPERPEGEDLAPFAALNWLKLVPSWLGSLLIHMSLLLMLALVVQRPAIREKFTDLIATGADSLSANADLDEMTPELGDGGAEFDQPEGMVEALSLSDEANGREITSLNDMPAPAGTAVDVGSAIGLEGVPVSDLLKHVDGGGGVIGGAGFDGRGDAAKKLLVQARGGSEGSENAVGLALAWIAAHQRSDGGWSFDHRAGACQGRCGNPGRMEHAEIAATAMALLPFLGAGQTHLDGKYKRNVQAGLYFLINRMKVGPNGGDMSYESGTMYGHGLASIALCEAYGMTRDQALAVPAQQAVDFIVYAQDPIGGGWRYAPRQPGDTSVVGWQLMALKSAHMAYLRVPPQTIKGISNFLNTVQMDSGAAYGYTDPGRGAATTAIGLLCRMHLGWKHDEPALERGVQFLSAAGPSTTNMYYNYYATQVLHHFEGEQWTKWNNKMRDFLVNAQSRKGHEKGSWYLGGDHASEQGGRLYTTSMATMTLEVYYRHLPIYRKESTVQEFDE